MALFIAAAVFSLDRFTKIAAMKFLHLGESVKVVPGVMNLTLVLNDGAAFGLFKGSAALFAVISLAVIVSIAAYLVRNRSLDGLVSTGLGLILGGALGNLADRMVFGMVIDFMDFRIWPVFNIADSCITIGAAAIILSLFVKRVR